MRLRDIISVFLFLVILIGISFAEPCIKITQPQDNTTVNPGQEINVTVEGVEGFIAKMVRLGVANFSLKRFKTLPASFNVIIPQDSSGTILVWAIAEGFSKNAVKDNITLKVQQIAILQSLDINQKILVDLDWNGNIKGEGSGYIVTVYGIYSDGITREIPEEELTFISSDPLVISVDNKGNYIVHKVGQATITVSKSGVTKIIPVVFEKPYGMRPKETISPTIKLNILPSANAEHWYNQDITITLTAQDNEGGSGIRDIFYEFPYLNAESNDVENTEVIIPFSMEGVNLMRYGATDNEGNDTGQQSVEICIDKTPPVVTIIAVPCVLWPPDNKMVDVTINGEAVDNLSGIESLTFKVIDEYGKIQPSIAGFGSTVKLESSRRGDDSDGRIYTITVIAKDKAGNKSSISAAVTVPHDMGKEKK